MANPKADRVSAICDFGQLRRGWLRNLSEEDRETAEAVRTRVIKEGLPHLPVAKRLVDALGLNVKPKTVTEWFREV